MDEEGERHPGGGTYENLPQRRAAALRRIRGAMLYLLGVNPEAAKPAQSGDVRRRRSGRSSDGGRERRESGSIW